MQNQFDHVQPNTILSQNPLVATVHYLEDGPLGGEYVVGSLGSATAPVVREPGRESATFIYPEFTGR